MLAKVVNESWKCPPVFLLPVTIKIQSDLDFVRFQVPVMTLLATTLTCVLMSTLLSNVLDAVHTLCLIEVSSKDLLETFRGFANKHHRPNTNAHSKDTDVHLLAAPMVFLSMFA
jgi:hypothetical protein